MKKRLLILMMFLVAIATGSWAEDQPYAALSNDNKTLTFYYDGQKAARGGMSVGPFNYSDDIGWHNQRGMITTVVFDASFADYRPTSTTLWFCYFKNLSTITGIENLKTDEVTTMSCMFYDCSSLTSLDLSSFNTANVTKMGSMFKDCSGLTSLDLSSFNTANVTGMGSMFSGCTALTKIAVDPDKWDTSKVTSSGDMFLGCTNLVGGNGTAYDANHTDVAYAVIDKDGTPGYLTGANVHIHTPGTAVIENKVDPSCTADGHYDNVVYCSVCSEELSRNTQYIPALGHDLTHVPEVPATTTAEGMKEHYTCSRCTDLFDKNYAIVTASDLVIPKLVEPEAYAALSNGNKTLTFYYDGQKASRNGMSVGPFTTDASKRGWDNQRQTITTVVFDASFANYRPTSTAVWFAGFLNLTTITNIENLKTDKVTDMYEMFYYCSSLTSLDLSGFNTEKVTNMNVMFCGCNNLTSLNVSSFNTSNVTNLNSMFLRCYSLTSLDLGSFNTVNVIDMAAMFGQCSSLTSLDLSSFNTGNVMNIQSMFGWCKALTRITVDPEKWNISNVMYGSDMFDNCNNLVGGNGTAYESNHRDATYAVIDKDGTPGYLTDVKDLTVPKAYAALSDDNKTLTFYYDFDKASRKGMSVGPFADEEERGWHNQRGTITTVVFDASFANYKPTSTAYWFFYFTNLTTITGIENLKTDEVTDMSYMFLDCTSLTNLDLSSFNTANVTNMEWMFDFCTSLTSLDLSSFNTANVTNMAAMFSWCSSLTSLDVSSFNTANVTNMGDMFNYCPSLTSLDLSSFNTANVTNMSGMFHHCSSLTSLDLSSFNTANVTNMPGMFYDCSSLTSLDLSSFNTAKVESMEFMFRYCLSLTSLDLSSFNTANVQSTDYMFFGCTALTKITVDPDKWDTSKVTNSYDMFYDCTNLVGGNGTVYDENHTDVAYAVIDKDGTPGYLTDVNAPVVLEAYAALSNDNKTLTFYYDGQKASRNGMSVGPFEYSSDVGWDNQKTTTITTVVFDASFANYRPTSTVYWFYGCNKLTTFTGIENLKTDDLTSMYCMFAGCSSLTSLDLSGFNTEKVTDMSYMFGNCYSLTNLDLSSFNTANVEYMGFMFGNCYSLTSLDLSSFNTANVTNMAAMFRGCSGLTSLDLSIFNTANVKFTYEMFYGCSSLTSLDLSSFNTANVTGMGYMFYNCSSLTSLDLSSFNTANVQSTDNMFSGCTALTKITVDPNKWDTSKVTYSEEMFKGCTNLVGGNGTAYDANHTDVAYAVIDKDGTPGYLTDVNVPVEPEAYAVLSGDGKTLTFYYDMEKASRGGMSVGPFDGNETLPAWSDKASGIRNANIDESFAGYTALTSTAYWFEGCSEIKAVSGLENLVMDNVTDMSSMFKGCNNLRSVSLSGMNTGKVTNMHGLFWDCNALQTIDLSTLDTRSVADMSGMFNYCNSLKTVDLSGMNTASVTDMNNMFYYCSSLTDLDLSSFNTASVTNMRYMFEGCSSLTKITVSETGWTTKAVNSGTAMFSGCRDIVGGNGTTYDAGHTDEGYARIDKAGTPGYLTSSAGTGINLLKTTPGGDGYFYTPDGRRIEGQPTKQGFYITNGRKVMAK